MTLIVKSDVYLNARAKCSRQLENITATLDELRQMSGNPVRGVEDIVLLDAIAEIHDETKRRWRFSESGFGKVIDVNNPEEWSKNVLFGFNVDQVQNMLDISDLIGNDIRNGLKLKQAFVNSKKGPLSRQDDIAVSRAFGLLIPGDLLGTMLTVPGFQDFVSSIVFKDLTHDEVLMDSEKIKKILELTTVFEIDVQQQALLVSNTARSIYPYVLESMSTQVILDGLENYLGKFPWWAGFKKHTLSISFIEKIDFRSTRQIHDHMLLSSNQVQDIELPSGLGM